MLVPGLSVRASVASTSEHGVPFAPDLLLTPIESAARPGAAWEPVDESAITGCVEVIAHEFFPVVNVWVVVPTLKY